MSFATLLAPEAYHTSEPTAIFANPGVQSGRFLTMFQIQNSTSDSSPYLLYPATPSNVWVATVPFGASHLTQVINFTLQNSGAWTSNVVANITNATPNDIIFDHLTNLVWIIENDSLAFYNQTTRKIDIAQTFQNASPLYATIDSRGNFWISLFSTDQIVEYSPIGRNYNATSTPTPSSGVYGVSISLTDGDVWFAEAYAGKLGRLTPCGSSSCPITEYTPPPGISIRGVVQVVVDTTGTVWFTVHNGNEFGSFNPSTGQWRLFPTGYCHETNLEDCTFSLPNAIYADSHNQIWFSEHYAGRIGRFNPNTDQLTEYVLPTTSKVCGKACTPYPWWMSGQGNRIWFVTWGLGEIGYVNASLPVPITVNAPSTLSVAQGSSARFPVVATYSDQPLSLNISATYPDTSTDPSMLSWSIGPVQLASVDQLETSTLSLSAAWTSSLGIRYIAASAYNQNITVNGYVAVDVVASLTPYITIGLSGVLAVFSVAATGPSWYKTRKRKAQIEITSRPLSDAKGK